jgi:Flp pilus assembly pilin Flp
MKRSLQRGQSMVEYAVAASALALALFFIETPGGKTAAQLLVDSVKAFFRNLTYFVSLP